MEFRQLVEILLEHQCSDMHLMAGLKPAMRVNRQIVPIPNLEPLSGDEIQALIFSILTREQVEEFLHHPQYRYEMDVAYSVPGLGRFRVNIYKQRGTIAAAIRSLSSESPKLEDLLLPECVHEFIEAKRGLVLVTGPARSGKSTTLAALVHRMNQLRSLHIITIEDPIEYLHNSLKAYVSQREVGRGGDTMSFKMALRQAIRQDPDVIQAGSLDDYEMIELALMAADNGALVLGTMPTVSVAQTLSRIIDIFPPDKHSQILTSLADNLIGIVAQVLLPRADGQGNCLAVEALRGNPQVKAAIRQNRLEGIYHHLAQNFDQAFIELAKNKLIDYDSVQSYIRSDATHRQIQTLLGINRPITHLPGHFTPLPLEPAGGHVDQEPSGMFETRPMPKVEYRTGLDQRPPLKPDSRSSVKTESKKLGKTIVPPWEKQKS